MNYKPPIKGYFEIFITLEDFKKEIDRLIDLYGGVVRIDINFDSDADGNYIIFKVQE